MLRIVLIAAISLGTAGAVHALANPIDSTTPPGAVGTCIKLKTSGDASTYNPNYAGWKTGGQGLATGGRYNPNNYEAALRLDLAKQYGCGYGSGKTCHAVVEDPASGRAMIVLINDNGPLVPGRVIDLNERSMQYLSNGKYGRNSGVIRNVTVTLLCAHTDFLGPLDPKERDRWNQIALDTPHTQLPPWTGTPYASGPSASMPQAIPISQLLQQMLQPSGLSGSGFLGQSQQAPLPNTSGQPIQPPPAQQGPMLTFSDGPSSGRIVVQPAVLTRAASGVVSWTTVNMRPSTCALTVNGKTLAQANEGTRRIPDEALTGSQVTFSLTCTTAGGQPFDRTEMRDVQ